MLLSDSRTAFTAKAMLKKTKQEDPELFSFE
jgi:hypothetical protein